MGDYHSDIPPDILEKKYPLENWSQKAINEGQRKINGELTALVTTLAKLLEALKDAIEKTPVGSKIDLGAIKTDITKAIARSEKVAGYYPPGCTYGSGGGGEGSGGGGGDT